MVSRCFPGGYNVKLYISRGRLAWWLLAFLHSDAKCRLGGSFMDITLHKRRIHIKNYDAISNFSNLLTLFLV